MIIGKHLIGLCWKVKEDIHKTRFLQHITRHLLYCCKKFHWKIKPPGGINLFSKGWPEYKAFFSIWPCMDILQTIVFQNGILIFIDYWYWCYMPGACPFSWWCRGSKNAIATLQQNCPFPQKDVTSRLGSQSSTSSSNKAIPANGDVWSRGATCKSPHKTAPQKPSGLVNLSQAPEGHKFCRASHNCFKTLNVFLLLCGFPAHGGDLWTHLILSLAEYCSICQKPLWNCANLS